MRDATQEWHLGELKREGERTVTDAVVRLLSVPSHSCLLLGIPSCGLRCECSGLKLAQYTAELGL